MAGSFPRGGCPRFKATRKLAARLTAAAVTFALWGAVLQVFGAAAQFVDSYRHIAWRIAVFGRANDHTLTRRIARRMRACCYEAWSQARAQCERGLDAISPRYVASSVAPLGGSEDMQGMPEWGSCAHGN